MSPRRSLAIGALGFRILRYDFFPIVLLILMPLVLIVFIGPTYGAVLRASGYGGATGSEQAIPGLSVVFAFFVLSYVGNTFYREHGWATWDRLRASEARPLEIVIGKLLPPLGVLAAQQVIVFGFGVVVLGLRVRGSVAGMALISASFVVFLVSLGVLVAAVCRGIQQISALANLGAIVLGGLGGGLTPVELMPQWVQAVAHLTPSYWAIAGFRTIILRGGGLEAAAAPVAYFAVGTLVCVVLASLRFHMEEPKTSWTT